MPVGAGPFKSVPIMILVAPVVTCTIRRGPGPGACCLSTYTAVTGYPAVPRYPAVTRVTALEGGHEAVQQRHPCRPHATPRAEAQSCRIRSLSCRPLMVWEQVGYTTGGGPASVRGGDRGGDQGQLPSRGGPEVARVELIASVTLKEGTGACCESAWVVTAVHGVWQCRTERQ